MVARRKASALVTNLAKEVRAVGYDALLDETVHDIFSERASGVNNEGIEAQIETILASDGIDEGSKTIRGLIEGGK